MDDHELLAYYTKPGVFTSLGPFAEQVDALPDDIASIAAAVQGLVIHEALAPAYRVVLSSERRAEKELHSAVAMLTCATRADTRPLSVARPPERRVVGVCRHFATMFVAILRHKGIPARAHCGFANYFEAGKNVDHWLGEYWNAGEERWILVDAQVDHLQKALFKIGIDMLNVPRDRFLVAGDAWRACRAGDADPNTFGVAGTDMWGLVEVFGDLWQDIAALQKIELLPWGWYALATEETGACDAHAELIDGVARLSSAADAHAVDRLIALAATDERFRVPADGLAAIKASDVAASFA